MVRYLLNYGLMGIAYSPVLLLSSERREIITGPMVDWLARSSLLPFEQSWFGGLPDPYSRQFVALSIVLILPYLMHYIYTGIYWRYEIVEDSRNFKRNAAQGKVRRNTYDQPKARVVPILLAGATFFILLRVGASKVMSEGVPVTPTGIFRVLDAKVILPFLFLLMTQSFLFIFVAAILRLFITFPSDQTDKNR
ncbi:hypothetical protein [Hansschlegelia sp. KR7-227]|uniref:hypothetical protein n=1 Tax=Hansschlegelia sp. KR7-227 TaxID=3400914 RepID=UPI003C066E32